MHDAESVNKQETILIRDASDVEEAALGAESTAKWASLRESELMEDSDTEDFSQSETVGFAEEALVQVERAEARQETRAKSVPQIFFGEVRAHLVLTEGDYVQPKTVNEAQKNDDWYQLPQPMKEELKALQDNQTWSLIRPPTDRDVVRTNWVCKLKWGRCG